MPDRPSLSGTAAVAACLLAGAACAAGPAKEPTLSRENARDAVAAVVGEVEEIRGLSFRKTVAVDSIDDARARALMTARLKKFVSEDKLRADSTAWSLLGLAPAGTDLLDAVLDALEEQAGGFYDPETKRFFLLDDMPAVLAPALAAHELTHALEDQYYDLDKRLDAVIEDDDATFATSAVHEGSAMVVMAIHLGRAMAAGSMKESDLQEFSKSEAVKAETLRRLPQALQRQFIGPYILGMNFVLRGDASRIARGYPESDGDRAYRAGPVSSEQILHPEKYWDPAGRDLPKKVDLTGAGTALGAGWSKAGAGVLGELLLAILAGAPGLDPTAASAQDAARWTNAAAAGWGGDRWELWSKGDRSVVLLQTVWDSEKDAREFAAALPTRAGLAWKQSGSRVGIVAGEGVDAAPLLGRLAP